MDSFHVITLVPASRKSIALASSVTVREFAQEGIHSVVMQSVGFSLVAEKTSIGRKSGILAFWSIRELAPVGPQMGIHVFAVASEENVRRCLLTCDEA